MPSICAAFTSAGRSSKWSMAAASRCWTASANGASDAAAAPKGARPTSATTTTHLRAILRYIVPSPRARPPGTRPPPRERSNGPVRRPRRGSRAPPGTVPPRRDDGGNAGRSAVRPGHRRLQFRRRNLRRRRPNQPSRGVGASRWRRRRYHGADSYNATGSSSVSIVPVLSDQVSSSTPTLSSRVRCRFAIGVGSAYRM